MPGIMGMIHKGPIDLRAKADLEQMVLSAMHEPFYKSGTYQDAALGLSVGWVCQQEALADGLPVWNEKRDIGLFFCGEEFSVEAEVPGLRAGGHVIAPGRLGPLVHFYEDRGDGFFKALNGCFSGLLADRRTNRIFLFNDRFGLGRIYYYENDRAFYFASEAKSLLRVLPELRAIDADGLAQLFAYGCLPDGGSLFAKVRLLPGGSKWAFSPESPAEQGAHFRIEEWADQTRLDEQTYEARFLRAFPQVLRRYFRDPESLGISLTGGLDTRMIMAWNPGPAFTSPCYTFSGVYRDCADVTIAKKVAAACGLRHETIRIGPDFFAEFPGLALRSVLYSDGTMDVSGAAELYVNRQAREIAPVRLTGNYGDQVIRGVVGFKPLGLRPDLFEAGFAARVAASRPGALPGDRDHLSFFCSRQVPWYHYPRHALEMSQLTVRSPFLDNDLVSLAFQAPASCRELGASLRFIRTGNPALARLATDRGFSDPSAPLFGAARRGIRTFSKLAEYAYDYGMPRWLTRLDNALSPAHLERLFLGRHKYYHFRIWYRRELKDYVQGIILDPRTLQRPYFERGRIERMVHDHLSGRDNFTQEIHWVLTSELIQRHLIEDTGPGPARRPAGQTPGPS